MQSRDYSWDLKNFATATSRGAKSVAASNILLAAVQMAEGIPSDEHIDLAFALFSRVRSKFDAKPAEGKTEVIPRTS